MELMTPEGISHKSPYVPYISIYFPYISVHKAAHPSSAVAPLATRNQNLGLNLRILLVSVGSKSLTPNIGGILIGGIPTPLKNMKVSWDDDIPNINGKIKNVPNHQPEYL